MRARLRRVSPLIAAMVFIVRDADDAMEVLFTGRLRAHDLRIARRYLRSVDCSHRAIARACIRFNPAS
jgi:hypothetical protein